MFGKNLEITPMESLFIMVLNNTVSLSGSEIVEKITSDLGDEWTPSPGATYKIIQSLEKKGYIQETTQKTNPKDQRIRTYALTSKGKDILPKLTSRVRKIVIFTSSCCPECCEGLEVGVSEKSSSND
jgi:DNA-binding PadR family transcriptional regulator